MNADASRTELTVSGATYDDAIEESGVPAEEGWPTPTVRRRGKGVQYVYLVTPEEARLIKEQVLDAYEAREGYADAAADRARLRGDLRRWGMIP